VDERKKTSSSRKSAGPLIGYARVATDERDLRDQRSQLENVGCSRIFSEKVCGAWSHCPQLERMLDQLRAGDVVTVTRLDRLARSTRDLLDTAETIQEAGAGLRSLAESWADTTSPAGHMVLTIFAGIAEFERSLILDRTRRGREAAMARGVRFGRPPALSDEQVAHASALLTQGRTAAQVAQLLGVHRATLYRALRRQDQADANEELGP